MERRAKHVSWRFLAVVIVAWAAGCGGGASSGGKGGAPGTAGASDVGAAGNVGSSGAAGETTGAAGNAATTGAAGQPSAAAGDTGAAGTAGATGGSGGGAGTTTPTDAGGGGTTGAAGSTDAGAAAGASGSTKILIYGVTTGFRHGSITAAANAITKAVMTAGLTTEQVGCTDATNKVDATKLTAAALAQYGAVILLATSGEPFGYPATQEIQNLVDYVHNGGALVAIEDADHCYDGGFNGHPASQPYVSLIGNDFVGHPGGVALATCTKIGTNASVAQLPATFGTTDEIYATTMFRMDNQVVLTCVSSGDGTHTMRPVSYVREEGAGRMFYTALGHDDARWTAPMDATAPSSRLVEDHVVPALLWAMRR
jgi:type 1 glutamine amidotransferase